MRRVLCLVLLLSLLSGCSSPAGPAAAEPPKEAAGAAMTTEAAAPEETAVPKEADPGVGELPADPSDWSLSDFAPALCAAPVSEERIPIAAGTEWENTVVVRRGAAEGAVIFVIGGVHGDETAGWTAANLLKEVCPRAGTVFILSPANTYGAENDQRTTKSMRDLNRNFPGSPEGWDAEQIAASIYDEIERCRPDLVLDLHETKGPQASAPERDDLRNTVIVSDVAPIGDLIWALTVEDAAGVPLELLGSPPAGSVNCEVSAGLGIPVITLETWRGEELSARVARQLAFAEAVLRFYGMV